MVRLAQVRASNSLISTDLPPGLVAVLVGATSGIGLYTLKALVKHAKQPRVYFVGRSEEAGSQIKSDCESLNPEGKFVFIKSDVALVKNVDDVCRRIKEEEDRINLLVLSQGTLVFGTDTEEGLHYAASLIHHSRVRFTLNLLPLLQQAADLRRVVSIFTGTKEGPLDISDIQARNVPFKAACGHAASLVTLGLEALAQRAPSVGFVHVFPGHVKSGIARGTTGFVMGIFKVVSEITGLFLRMDTEECGERHLFLCTSERYRARETGPSGSKVMKDISVARGVDGNPASGVYSVDENGESANRQVEVLLANMRKQNLLNEMWKATIEDFVRITGSETI